MLAILNGESLCVSAIVVMKRSIKNPPGRTSKTTATTQSSPLPPEGFLLPSFSMPQLRTDLNKVFLDDKAESRLWAFHPSQDRQAVVLDFKN